MILISQKTKLPGKQTRAYELLELAAIFGEFPSELLTRLSGGDSYKEKIVTTLKQQGLLKTYYKDGRRGLRPTTRAKRLLLADNLDRFSFFMDENSDTNHVRSEPHRRERLHRIAEAIITMKNAGVKVFRDERPEIFSREWESGELIEEPLFYSSREIQELGYQYSKMKGSRSVGVLLTEQDVFITYSLNESLIKWSYKSEMRMKILIQNYLCLDRMSYQYSRNNLNGLLLGNSMELALKILESSRQQYFVLDGNYDNFYFVTKDEKGDMLLRLLCRPDLCCELEEILTDDLRPQQSGFVVENDAMTEDGRPVILAYKCDLNRIRRFNTALTLREMRGVIICFDYQADVLRRYCSEAVEFQTIDYTKTERRFYS